MSILELRKRLAVRRYNRDLSRLGRATFPCLRSAITATAATRAGLVSALECDDDLSEAWLQVSEVLDRVAASETGRVLIDAEEGADEHYDLWVSLAKSWCHEDRAEWLIALSASYVRSGHLAAVEALREIARTEYEAARRFPDHAREPSPLEPMVSPFAKENLS
jgi:hypothetical protein